MIQPLVAKNKNTKVRVVCPVCNKSKDLTVPKSIVNNSSQLTTLSVPKGAACEHHFQAFLDKNFKVRGYQKVDFTIGEFIDSETNNSSIPKTETTDKKLFDNMLLDGNYLEYFPSKGAKLKFVEKKDLPKTEMTLAEIYEEFWEFVDDSNEKFADFVSKDNRKKEMRKKEALS